MRAVLAHEQHQPVVGSGDEAMGTAKLPRRVYDRGGHRNLRPEATTLVKVIIGSTAWAIGMPPMRTEKTQCRPPLLWLRLQCCHRTTGWVFVRAAGLTR